MLRLTRLSRRFGRQLALDRLTLHARRGECYGFLGANGAGKTTAMRIAVGLLRASEGGVRIGGLELAERPREARARLGALIEVPGFHGTWSGEQNLVALARLAGRSRAQSREEARRLLALVGLAQAQEKPVQAYSHGMRQRLGLAQALLGEPELVLLDEPTSGLDPEGIVEVRALLARLVRERGVALVVSSHQLAEIEELVDRVGLLRQGRLVLEERLDLLLASGAGRYLVRARRPERVLAVCRARGLGAEELPGTRGDGLVRVTLAEGEQEALLRALLEEDLGLASFAPEPKTLEELYLERSRAEGGGTEREEHAPEEGPPAEVARVGAITAIGRVARYELTRWLRGSGALLCAAAPLALAAIALLRRRAQALEHAREVQGAEVFSTTDVTAFEAFGVAYAAALPLAAWLALALASQQLAGELGRGTLRNVLLRPLTRLDVLAGKALALLGWTVVAWAALAGLSLGLASLAFEWTDVVEVLPNGVRFPLVEAEALRAPLRSALLLPLAPLAAFGALGLCASALARSGVGALALALGLGLVLELARVLVRGLPLERALPGAHLPSPLGDGSYLRTYLDLAQGVANAVADPGPSAWLAPFAWVLGALAIAALVFSQRSVP